MSSPPPTYMHLSCSRPLPPLSPHFLSLTFFLWNTRRGNLELKMSLHVCTLAHKRLFLYLEPHKLSRAPISSTPCQRTNYVYKRHTVSSIAKSNTGEDQEAVFVAFRHQTQILENLVKALKIRQSCYRGSVFSNINCHTVTVLCNATAIPNAVITSFCVT